MKKSNDNLLPKIKKENFLINILNKIHNIFFGNKDIKQNIQYNNYNKDFVNNLKTDNIKILEMQQRYEAGTLDDYQMTNEQISALEELYRKQIVEIRENIRNYKNKIVIERRKVGILN